MPKFLPGESGNKAGRPPNSKNKVPSNKDAIDELKKGNTKALAKLLELMRSGEESIQFKAAVKILDINYEIVMEEEKQKRIDKKKIPQPTTGDTASVSVSEPKPGAKVMRIRG